MSDQRRLAAILVADVVGYSKLVGTDEAGTLAQLQALRTNIIEPAIAKYVGRLFKAVGDGFLVEFASAVQAVEAAQAIQRANADGKLPLRIGIHVGDVVVQGDDLMGDGVNIAARIEGIADPGGIAISRQVRDQVRDKLAVDLVDKGEVDLKNIARPVRVFTVAGSAAQPFGLGEGKGHGVRTLTLPDKPSIAVLPFQNMSGDPEQEYFVDGLVEDIITGLSRFKSLFVIARNSSFTYKGKTIDTKQVGRELGVRYLLEGSVRRAAKKVRITGQLIDGDTGAHLWADRFDGTIEDVFELQDQVTTSVVGAIAPKLTQAEIERAKRRSVENVDAYDSYLRGLAHLQEMTRASCADALRLFYRAIELDPAFAAPYGMAARCYVTHKGQGWTVSKERDQAEVRRLASSIAVVGRDDALALSWAGFSLVWICREFDTGAASVDQALAINPNLAVGWINRGFVSTYLGEHHAALQQLERAMRLSPMDPETYRTETGMALARLMLGEYDEALNWTAQALARQPNWRPAMWVAASASALAGKVDEARSIVTRMSTGGPSFGFSDIREFITLRRPQDIDRISEGFRLAGLSE